MTSSMKLETPSSIERAFTNLQHSITYGLQNSGVHTWNGTSSRIRSRSAWLWSRSPGQSTLRITGIVMSMELHTLPSQGKSVRLIGMTLTVTRNMDPNRWCDYCKARWGKNRDGSWADRAQKPAMWLCTSETGERKGRTRYYCNDCAIEVSTQRDGSFWSLDEQMDYSLGKQVLDV